MNAVTVNSTRRILGRAAVLSAFLLAGTLGVAQAAPAPAPADVPAVVVSYNDLDLSSAAGASTLYSRISAAARQVCPAEDSTQLKQVAYSRACRRAAIDRAVAEVHSAQLAALSAEHAKRG